MTKFNIAGRKVGDDHPPLVIAEVGINHEGSLEKALEMVDAAVKAKADIVKFQCHITEAEMIKTNMCPGDISDEPLWDIIKRCELTEAEEIQLKEYCDKSSIIFLSTPFSREACDRLDNMGVPAFKIGSGECNNLPLLEHVASKGKPIILSTGMNDIESIKKSVALIQKFNVPLALMHCTSMYPTPYNKVRLAGIQDIKQNIPNVEVGLSDHSLGIYTCLGAVALGATLLEKHFTISREWPGPDTAISIEPNELEDLVKGSRAVWEAKGGSKDILPEEKPVIDFAYASVVTIGHIKKGDILSKKNIWVKRPGLGEIPASQFDGVLSKVATKDIPEGTYISLSDING